MKRLYFAIVVIFVLAIFIPAKAEAVNTYSYTITDLPQNKWMARKENVYANSTNNYHAKYNVFKIKAPSNGYIKIESNDSDSYIYSFLRLPKDTSPFNDYYGCFHGENEYYAVVPSGTSYLHTDGTSNKIRWSFIKASNPSNNCRSKAKPLAKNKKETIVFNDGYEYSRWYKVTLKKKQPLTVNLKCLDSNDNIFQVFSSKGEEINCPPLIGYKTYRTMILPKGTYYIRIGMGRNWDDNPWESEGRIKEFSWK